MSQKPVGRRFGTIIHLGALEQIEEIIQQPNDRGWTISEIGFRLQSDYKTRLCWQTMNSYLSRLMKMGKIKEVRRGRYRYFYPL